MWSRLLPGGCTIFKGCYRLFFLGFFFVCSNNVFAADNTEPVKLKLKPHICVLSKAETHCDDQFIAEWEVVNNQYLSLCLYQENKSDALACWNNARLGRAEIFMSLKETTAFELRTTADQTLMAREFFKVIYAQRNTRRNPWSFF